MDLIYFGYWILLDFGYYWILNIKHFMQSFLFHKIFNISEITTSLTVFEKKKQEYLFHILLDKPFVYRVNNINFYISFIINLKKSNA